MAGNSHLVSARRVNARQNERLVVVSPAHVGEGRGGVAGVGVRSWLSPYEELLVLAGGDADSVIAVDDETEGYVVVVYQVHHGRRLHLCCLWETTPTTSTAIRKERLEG